MLQQFSWPAYAALMLIAAVVYYGFVFLSRYRSEVVTFFRRLSGRSLTQPHRSGDLLLPEVSVLGPVRPENMELIPQEELLFAPEEEPVTAGIQPIHSDLSEMISETKTLIRVINESGESKENFKMLFKLIIQKYPELIGTPYEDQVNHFLLKEGAEHFPFSLTLSELKTYWSAEQELQSA